VQIYLCATDPECFASIKRLVESPDDTRKRRESVGTDAIHDREQLFGEYVVEALQNVHQRHVGHRCNFDLTCGGKKCLFRSDTLLIDGFQVIGDSGLGGLDEFTSLLTENDARLLVDLLKLAVADRIEDDQAKEILSSVLISETIYFS
jgi:hypothetical protein